MFRRVVLPVLLVVAVSYLFWSAGESGWVDGAERVTPVPSGTGTALAEESGGGPASPAVGLDAPTTIGDDRVLVRCVDESGASPEGVDVVAFGAGSARRHAHTDKSGTVTLRLSPAGNWQLVASSPTGGRGYAAVGAARSGPVTIALRGAAAIEGVATNSAGEPLVGLLLQFAPRLDVPATGAARLALTDAVRTRADGSFEIRGLARGVEHEITPQIPGAERIIARPPETLRIVIDPKWTLELHRAPTPFDFSWDVTSIAETDPLPGRVRFARRSSGSWPETGADSLLIPLWPGRSRVRTRVAYGNETHETEVDLAAAGAQLSLRIPLRPSTAAVRLRNPHSTPAAVFRSATEDLASATVVIAPGEARIVPISRGRTEFRSAVYPGGITEWDVTSPATQTTRVDVPPSTSAPSVRLTVAAGDGGVVRRFQLLLHPAPTGFRVAYSDRVPALFTGSVTLAGSDLLVVADDADKFEVLAKGRAKREGAWPLAGRLEIRLDRAK